MQEFGQGGGPFLEICLGGVSSIIDIFKKFQNFVSSKEVGKALILSVGPKLGHPLKKQVKNDGALLKTAP